MLQGLREGYTGKYHCCRPSVAVVLVFHLWLSASPWHCCKGADIRAQAGGEPDFVQTPYLPKSARRLELAQFNGWTLTQPRGSNLLSFMQELVNLLDVRAGAPYYYVKLHATSNLGTDFSAVRIKLMLPTASDDVDCHPGSGHEAPHVVTPDSPATPLDGLTPARDPAVNYENSWAQARFPYSGVFEACYFSGSEWYHVPGQFTVKGADSNTGRFWCIASTTFQCRLLITGLGVRSTWTFAVVDHTSQCGNASDFNAAFERNHSVGAANPLDAAETFHNIGAKRDGVFHTYQVCYCPGFAQDGALDPCTMPGDFVQSLGRLYVTRVVPPQTIYPMVRWDLVLRCGAEAAGGCPMSRDIRFRLVDPAQANDAPSYDSANGCRTAPQALEHSQPPNCEAPTDCHFEPAQLSRSAPTWLGLRVLASLENHAQKPLPLDVCVCLEACSQPASWFKADQVSSQVIQVLPDPMVASSSMDLRIYGPSGGWTLTGNKHAREVKLLFDPEGTTTADDCFVDPQDVRALSGHYCYSTTDCKSPTTSTQDGHVWENVEVHFAGMYAVCYCDDHCSDRQYWSFLKWHLVAGPYSKHVWEFSRGINFDLRVSGWGLKRTDRLRVLKEEDTCGDSAASPAAGVDVPGIAPLQLADLTEYSIRALSYSYDGVLMTMFNPHGLALQDYISVHNVTSPVCGHCADLVNGRPHKVIRVPSATEIVIPVSWPERSFPAFIGLGGTWVRSSEVTFQGFFGSMPGAYRVCWGSELPTAAEDFSALVGTLSILEPPIFAAQVHLTSVQGGTVAPVVIAFATRHDQKYVSAEGEMHFRVKFSDLARLAPGFSFAASEDEVALADAKQHVCGRLFKELWSSDADGFPMPKGCFYRHGDPTKEYSFLFSAKNGLKPGTHYQIVMDAEVFTEPSNSMAPRDGVIQLWSMNDVTVNPFGVIEFGPAWLDRSVIPRASGSSPQFHSVDGFRILVQDAEAELSYESSWQVHVELSAAAGAPIVQGTLMRIFLWPLTQWDIDGSCAVACLPHQATAATCQPPICRPDAVVPLGVGSKRNVMKLTFTEMDRITDLVRHTIVLSQLRLPPGGFFSTALGAELQAAEGERPSYMASVGGLLYAKPSAAGSIVSGTGDGEDQPFRGDQGNTLYARLVLGASLWAAADDDAGFEVRLPPGYRCTAAMPAESDLAVLRGLAPQGRGEIGLDDSRDGYWLLAGQSCTYKLRQFGVVYAGSAVFLKLTVNNPVYALPRTADGNIWTVQLRGKAAPFVLSSQLEKLGRVSSFTDRTEHLRRNSPVLGKLSGVTLSPMLLGAGQGRNWLSVFFTTEQGSPDTAPRLQLEVPDGFGFLPRCVVEALPPYHYASMSSRRTGLTLPTNELTVVHCEAAKVAAASTHLTRATMTLSRYAKLKPATTYGLRVLVFNSEEYAPSQHDGFRLTTSSAAGDGLDATPYTMRFLASDGEGPSTSFGVYQLPMASGAFVVSLDNMLPYSETGIQCRIIVFPLRVPFDARSAVDWRIAAPYGYEWDFGPDQFQYRTQDIMGATADLPIARIPVPPALPPRNALLFSSNFQGSWDRMETYGLIARIRVPDATPRSSSNSFYVEFGYAAQDIDGRLAAASCEAPRVRALVNAMVDYEVTNLAGQQNRLLIQLETITNLLVGGGLVMEAPQGFVFEETCVILDNPMRQDPYLDLRLAAPVICTSEVPYTTEKPLVTIAVVRGEIRAAWYEFMMDVQNPRWTHDSTGMSWTISSYANIGLTEAADLAAVVDAFPIEAPMSAGELVNDVSYTKTQRDDHPLQRSFVTIAFELSSRPSAAHSVVTVKAPLGFKFMALCQVVVGAEVFGPGEPYFVGYVPFEAAATVTACEGSRNTARITLRSGLLELRRYAFRLEVFNPEVTPEHNRWTVSFGGESTVPIHGYRLWVFSEVLISASHAARSTATSETQNLVTVRFRPTNAVKSNGFLAVTAPFGFRIPTECEAQVLRLDPLGQALAALPHLSCHGAPQPTNAAEVHITDSSVEVLALELHQMAIQVINPSTIPMDPGTWHLQSYGTKEAEYSSLLDVGEGVSFAVTEVFHTFLLLYPSYVSPLDDKLDLRLQLILPDALELGDTLEIHGPQGYDFSMPPSGAQHVTEFRTCRGFSRTSPDALPEPICRFHEVRFSFQSAGIPLEPEALLTPLLDFGIQTLYPRRTLALAATRFYGEHLRGTHLMSSKTVQGELVTPRLQGLAVTRLDRMLAVGSSSSFAVAFTPSQGADALLITTGASQSGIQDPGMQFSFSEAQATATVELQLLLLAVAERTNDTVVVEMTLQEGLAYVVTLQHVVNPVKPVRALWTLTTFARPEASASDWWLQENRRDRSENLVGPPTYSRLALDRGLMMLAASFFDMDTTELRIAFHVYPMAISAGQYLILEAPFGYTLIDRTFKPGDGFPLVSGSVYARAPTSSNAHWRYVIQVLTRIRPNQIIQFGVRVNTPRTPEDIAIWEVDHSSAWLLMAAQDADGLEPTASNDKLFPGFALMASFGTVRIEPEPNGVTPRKRVAVTVAVSPRTTLRSLLEDGSVHVRVTAPLGFDFDLGCLAVTPNPAFSSCEGQGRVAVLAVRDASLRAGLASMQLWVTNAGITPASNLWKLEAFVDELPGSDAAAAPSARQMSLVDGYEIRELLQATIGANTQQGAVTVVFVWFLATHFLDVGGVVELHAPQTYELRCTPQVEFITLPPGTCRLRKGVTASSGDVYHNYVALTLTMPDKLVYPNTPYEFGVSTINPHAPVNPNFWGLVLMNPRQEVVDASMTLDGYGLTDFGLLVHSLLASSTHPAVVNYVHMTLTFQKEIAAGMVGHVMIRAPSSTKVICTRFSEITAGGSAAASLPLDPERGIYGTHTCQLQNSITLHILQSEPIHVGSHVIKLGVLNPGIRALRDYWAVELLAGTRAQEPSSSSASLPSNTTGATILQVQVRGFGVSRAFIGPTIPAVQASPGKRPGASHAAWLLLALLLR